MSKVCCMLHTLRLVRMIVVHDEGSCGSAMT